MGITVVVITHEMLVVKEICDRVAVMDNGRIVEKNDIVPIFVNPIQEMTRNFIATANNSNKVYELLEDNHPLTRLKPNQQLLRITYGSSSASQALISDISRRFDVECSIIYGNVEVIKDNSIGTLVTVVSGNDADIRSSIDYLRTHEVNVEVMKRGHID